MKPSTRCHIKAAIITTVTIIGLTLAQAEYLKVVVNHIYKGKCNTAEQALMSAARACGGECTTGDIAAAFSEYLDKWDALAPFRISVLDADGNSLHMEDGTYGRKIRKSYRFTLPYRVGGGESLCIDYDYKAALFNNISPVLFVTVSLNGLILLLVLLLVFVIRRKRALTGAQKSFVNVVAHNLRNPIAVAQAADEALSASNVVKEDPACTSLVEIIMRQLDTLNKQVESVLRKARTGEQYDKSLFKEVKILSFVEDLVSSYALSHPEAFFCIDIDPSHVISAVPEQLSSMLSVIIDNSIKYSLEAAQITVFTKMDKKGRIYISIKDRGIGFNRKEKRKAFFEYYRGSRGRMIDTTGFGLGLHYVKQTAKANRWKIKLESVEGEGSTLTIIAR